MTHHWKSLDSYISTGHWATKPSDETLVLLSLGTDGMLTDNPIICALGAVLDWGAQELYFRDSDVTLPASHRIRNKNYLSASTQRNCSVATMDVATEAIPVYLSKSAVYNHNTRWLYKYIQRPPVTTTPALTEPRVVINNEVRLCQTPKAFHGLVVGRAVCQWSATNRSAIVQIANASNRLVY